MASKFGIAFWDRPTVVWLNQASLSKDMSPLVQTLMTSSDFYYLHLGMTIEKPQALNELEITVILDSKKKVAPPVKGRGRDRIWVTVYRYFPTTEFREVQIVDIQVGVNANLDFATLANVIAGAAAQGTGSTAAVQAKMVVGPFRYAISKRLIHGFGLNQRKLKWKISSKELFAAGDLETHVIVRVSEANRRKLPISVHYEAKSAAGLRNRKFRESRSRIYNFKLPKIKAGPQVVPAATAAGP